MTPLRVGALVSITRDDAELGEPALESLRDEQLDGAVGIVVVEESSVDRTLPGVAA